jgi:CubicO group peptidase (beta-lactamase class C family)
MARRFTWIVLLLAAHAAVLANPDALEERIQRIENGLLPTVLVKGETPQSTRLADAMAAAQVPGVSVAVIEDGKIAWARGYGVSVAGGASVTPRTLFQAASISKPISAVAALQLVEAGKVDLDADVNGYLKSWKVPASELTAREHVTLQRLLTHSAGLTVHGFPGYSSGQPLPTMRQILDGETPANSAAVRVDSTPGQIVRYSGGGYQVMQQLVEDVSGTQFPRLMQARVLEPLGMSDSTFQQPLPAELSSRVALPHYGDGQPVKGGPHTYPELAAAGLWTTPSDLARFAIGMQNAWAGTRGSVLSKATAQSMMTPLMQRQGLGPIVGGATSRQYFMHGGGNVGYRCLLIAYLDGDGAAVMTSGDRGGEVMNALMRTIAREYQWPDFAPPERVLTQVEPTTFDRHVGAYRFQSGTVITVWRENDRRYSRVKGAPITELFPTAEREYFQKALPAHFEFLEPAAASATALVLSEGEQRREATRLSSSESEAFVNEALAVSKRVREQKPLTGSDAALRQLLTSMQAGQPDYETMTADFANLTRRILDFVRADLAPLGAIRSVTFREVRPSGSDAYDLSFENGTASATITLESDGRIGEAYFERR